MGHSRPQEVHPAVSEFRVFLNLGFGEPISLGVSDILYFFLFGEGEWGVRGAGGGGGVGFY